VLGVSGRGGSRASAGSRHGPCVTHRFGSALGLSGLGVGKRVLSLESVASTPAYFHRLAPRRGLRRSAAPLPLRRRDRIPQASAMGGSHDAREHRSRRAGSRLSDRDHGRVAHTAVGPLELSSLSVRCGGDRGVGLRASGIRICRLTAPPVRTAARPSLYGTEPAPQPATGRSDAMREFLSTDRATPAASHP